MRKSVFWAAWGLLAASLCGAQQPDEPGPTLRFDNSAAKEPVYLAGADVTTPEIASVGHISQPTEKCEKKLQGEVQLRFVVDRLGNPRAIYFGTPLGNDLDRVALHVLEADRFKPGTHDGLAAAVAMAVTVKIDGCVTTVKRGEEKTFTFWLATLPEQTFYAATEKAQDYVSAAVKTADAAEPLKVGGKVKAPKAIFQPNAGFTDAAQSKVSRKLRRGAGRECAGYAGKRTLGAWS